MIDIQSSGPAGSFGNRGVRLKPRLAALYIFLAAANIAAWAAAFVAFYGAGMLLGTALIAYGLGLRHAVDADHIAAIDNVTRKLMQEGQRPLAGGFWFALAHLTIIG